MRRWCYSRPTTSILMLLQRMHILLLTSVQLKSYSDCWPMEIPAAVCASASVFGIGCSRNFVMWFECEWHSSDQKLMLLFCFFLSFEYNQYSSALLIMLMVYSNAFCSSASLHSLKFVIQLQCHHFTITYVQSALLLHILHLIQYEFEVFSLVFFLILLKWISSTLYSAFSFSRWCEGARVCMFAVVVADGLHQFTYFNLLDLKFTQ